MAITGIHALLHTPEAEALRDMFRDVFEWPNIDAGDGWLIFGLPPAELGVHPADRPAHQLSIMCDDLDTTMDELSEKGVEFRSQPADEGWGMVVTMVLPGNVEMMLYQPRHDTAI